LVLSKNRENHYKIDYLFMEDKQDMKRLHHLKGLEVFLEGCGDEYHLYYACPHFKKSEQFVQ
jgi:hypothetical protein